MSIEIDITEKGASKDGKPQVMDRRLFMQLQVFELDRIGKETPQKLGQALEKHRVPGVVYEDSRSPRRFGLLTWSEDPAHFVEGVRKLWTDDAFSSALLDEDYSMLGRTYSIGYESDLAHWIIRRPVETVSNPKWPWAVWYPLRRTGAFARLPAEEQRKILGEHAVIGRAYGEKDLAHDVRLACHGLDRDDNEFVIGLVGATLHPLSHVVQRMRSTRQTSEFIEKMGPFFVGKVAAVHNP